MKKLEELLGEKRCAYNPQKDIPEINFCRGLYDLVRECVTKDTVMVEIGCHRGVSTELFAMHCKKIYAVDPWQEPKAQTAKLEFEERLKGYDNIETIVDFSANACRLFDNESVDLVYIDGQHSYEAIKEDFHCWWPKIKIGGVISGHDNVYTRDWRPLGDHNREAPRVRAFLKEIGFWDKTRLAQNWGRKLYSDTSWSFIKRQKDLP
jgi:predicted O-methyltransferase YrrM